MSKSVNIIRPGVFSTVQDLGRFGLQRYGVPQCGVLDCFAAKVANLLVGNNEQCAVLEMTINGPELEILEDCFIAVTGAKMEVSINGLNVETWRSFSVHQGDIVSIGYANKGCRAYLAFSGGIDVPVIMGSRACYVGGKFGGYKGRPLQKGDTLYLNQSEFSHKKEQCIPSSYIPNYKSSWLIRVIAGPQQCYFNSGLKTFFKESFLVTSQSNRMGYRLSGAKIKRKTSTSPGIISEPHVPGSIQIPESGDPIILLNEQTMGGYAKIATIISDDICKVAQAMPGNSIRFKAVDIDEAFEIQKENRQLYHLLKREALSQKKSPCFGKQYLNSKKFSKDIRNWAY